ncbi:MULTISPECIES: hypothetical protein [unclassified Acidiphilium]|jgi:ElaB/YqjD/DUF883 family membrane-anchored ribosome-binding protein|uniref:hypothetical protein n=1 Tax=unclassified Acidiphilium TaxID=2617493 RepID=UPI000BC8B0C2|nr:MULTISPECIES: hypothetical protein [unclassified Acidiphilium]OYV55967.1 MAG: hypothetical protein B7Z76_07910 [Acidiphilium sp. 20-67-58]HQT61555.1 hypothetical protein [Acidiphilium sp.]
MTDWTATGREAADRLGGEFDRFQHEFEALRARLAGLAGEIAGKAGDHAASDAQTGAQTGVQAGAQAGTQAFTELRAALDGRLAGIERDIETLSRALRVQGGAVAGRIEDTVREKPLAALAMAAGLGFVAAHLFRRRRAP